MTLPMAYPGAIPADFPAPGVAVQTGRRHSDGKMIWLKVIDLGAMPNVAFTPKNVAHGETIDTLVDLWGHATAGGALDIPLPFMDPTATGQIGMERNGANIVLTSGLDRSAFTGAAIMEFTI